MAFYCCGGGGASPTFNRLLAIKSSPSADLWSDSGTTFTCTITNTESFVVTIEVQSDYSNEIAVTCDGTTVESSFTLEAGTHTILITITGYHYGTVKAGTLYVYGKTTSNPTVTLN